MWFARLAVCLTIVVASLAENQLDFRRSLGKNCDKSYTPACLKLDVIGWVDSLSEKQNIDVIPGVKILRENVSQKATNADIVAELGREFPNDPDSRLDGFLSKKIQNFLGSHSLKLNLAEDDSNSVTARKKKGKGNGLGTLLALGAMMKSTYLALALGALAGLAGKALTTGIISLVLSLIIGLKSLTSGGDKTTYEVVSKPVYTHSSSHSSGHEDYHSGHGRSFERPLPLGLQPGYNPA